MVPADLRAAYPDVYTPEALQVLRELSRFDADRQSLMQIRAARRADRLTEKRRIDFLRPDTQVGRTGLSARDARAGHFVGGAVPHDLQRQWVQGTGPAAKPNAPIESSLRNVAYALLSGADGWMFDGEDALGQVATMSLDNQRNLKLAIHRDPKFLGVAAAVAVEMNTWAATALGRPLFTDWEQQLGVTTKLFRPRGLHLTDRHVTIDGDSFSASIVDTVLYIVNNHGALTRQGSSLVLYLPKIQTAEEAWLWNEMLSALERVLLLPPASIRTYVLVEQVEASFQLMEIRAALSPRFVGYNTGRWDYINSVVDAAAWDPRFVHPDIDAITMRYGYMRNYEDRVRRAANTPDRGGNYVLWQGGMEPNIPVGSPLGVKNAMQRAVAGAERELEAGASGKWVAHWKMVPTVRPVWERHGIDNQMGRRFAPLTYTEADADALFELEPAPRTVRGARALISVGLQYGNAFSQGFQAAALKPADYFGDDDVLYLMEDMATGEIRLGILWEWLHKRAPILEDDASGVKAGDPFTRELFLRLVEEEYRKLQAARDRDVHDDSKQTTLPISLAALEAYVLSPVKLPWYVDLLNINLDVMALDEARRRLALLLRVFRDDDTRLTNNLNRTARHQHALEEI